MQDDFNGENLQNGNERNDDDFSIDSILKQENRDNEYDEPQNTDSNDRVSYISAEDEPSDSRARKSPVRKRKKKRSFKGLIWGVVIAAIAIILAGTIVIGSCELLGLGKEMLTGTKNVQLYIEEGTSVKEIASMLKDNDIVISKYLFLLYYKVKGDGAVFNYGYHDFKQDMGYKQIISALGEPAKKEDLEVKIPEGKSIDEIAELMEKKEVCSAEDFKDAALNGSYDSLLLDAVPTDDSRIHYRLEGYLFPDTYRFFKNDDPKRVIQKMLDNTESHYTEKMREKTAELGYTTHQMMAMASVIELESCGYFDQMKSVSAVFWNRMNNWEPGWRFLQSDVTMKYPYGDGSYNTYENEGLPPGPLCNITAEAMEAAVFPEEGSEYYFFVTDSKFRFYYNKTDAEHARTIATLKSRGLWLG